LLNDVDKKGTIVLSHYRSGGTQLLSTIWLCIGEKNTTNFSEWKGDGVSEFCELLDSADKYSLVLLNNPIVLAKFYQNGLFNKLKDDYHIVVLERKDKVKCLLSYELWEAFIKSGLFKDKNNWTEKNMQDFHNKTIDSIKIKNVDTRIKDFVMDIHLLQKLQQDLDLPKIYYEDFEYDRNYLKSWFVGIDEEHILKVSKICEQKIPYVSKNYLDYYTDVVKNSIREWRLDEL